MLWHRCARGDRSADHPDSRSRHRVRNRRSGGRAKRVPPAWVARRRDRLARRRPGPRGRGLQMGGALAMRFRRDTLPVGRHPARRERRRNRAGRARSGGRPELGAEEPRPSAPILQASLACSGTPGVRRTGSTRASSMGKPTRGRGSYHLEPELGRRSGALTRCGRQGSAGSLSCSGWPSASTAQWSSASIGGPWASAAATTCGCRAGTTMLPCDSNGSAGASPIRTVPARRSVKCGVVALDRLEDQALATRHHAERRGVQAEPERRQQAGQRIGNG